MARGRKIAFEICTIEETIFGAVKNDHTHPVVRGVEAKVGRLEELRVKVESVERPKLQRLRDCHQFHRIRKNAREVCGMACFIM